MKVHNLSNDYAYQQMIKAQKTIEDDHNNTAGAKGAESVDEKPENNQEAEQETQATQKEKKAAGKKSKD